MRYLQDLQACNDLIGEDHHKTLVRVAFGREFGDCGAGGGVACEAFDLAADQHFARCEVTQCVGGGAQNLDTGGFVVAGQRHTFGAGVDGH